MVPLEWQRAPSILNNHDFKFRTLPERQNPHPAAAPRQLGYAHPPIQAHTPLGSRGFHAAVPRPRG